jgi:hypothetical protein
VTHAPRSLYPCGIWHSPPSYQGGGSASEEPQKTDPREDPLGVRGKRLESVDGSFQAILTCSHRLEEPDEEERQRRPRALVRGEGPRAKGWVLHYGCPHLRHPARAKSRLIRRPSVPAGVLPRDLPKCEPRSRRQKCCHGGSRDCSGRESLATRYQLGLRRQAGFPNHPERRRPARCGPPRYCFGKEGVRQMRRLGAEAVVNARRDGARISRDSCACDESEGFLPAEPWSSTRCSTRDITARDERYLNAAEALILIEDRAA